jgi:hypothetical protein
MAYSEKDKTKIVNEICEKVSNGSTLRKALKESEIANDTFFRWIDEDEQKSKRYARATELRAEAMAEELLSIVDATEDDIITDEFGNQITNHNVIQRDRLRSDARKWLMSKMFSKKYGDNKTVDLNVKQEQPLFPDAE